MTKEKMIQALKDQVQVLHIEPARIYGVPMGVGIDYEVIFKLKKDGDCVRVRSMQLHAGPRGWDLQGYLRPNNYNYNEYKGTDKNPEAYIPKIEAYLKRDRLAGYFRRFKKDTIKKLYKSWVL